MEPGDIAPRWRAHKQARVGWLLPTLCEGSNPPSTYYHLHTEPENIMTTTAATSTYSQNVHVINGTVLMTSSFELPAQPKQGKRGARPTRTMGIIGIVDANGTYTEVTDFSKAWESLTLDAQYRIVADKQVRTKDGREQTYHNLVRAMPAPAAAEAAPVMPF